MKKNLLALTLSLLACGTLRADLIFYEGYPYLNGPIVQTSTNLDGSTNWFRHSGTANPSDAIMRNGREEVQATGGTLVSRQDDVHRDFCRTPGCTYTSALQVVYASFTVNCTNLPTVSNYFAHFYVNSSTFHGRVNAGAGSTTNTWRLGILGAAGTLAQIKVFPVDLAKNTDYQVVVGWNPTASTSAEGLLSETAYLWVNPTNFSDLNLATSDAVSATAPETAYGFRQGSTFGNAAFYITNLAVATTFDEAATNVWPTSPVPPVIVASSPSATNFVGDNVTLYAVANGQGLANITYQWRKGGGAIGGATSTSYNIPSAAIGDTGNYDMIASNIYGLSVTSAVAFLWVTNPPIPPIISTNLIGQTNVYDHQDLSLQFVASGSPPITYQWYHTNGALMDGANWTGSQSDVLTITDVLNNNSTTGAYYMVACNPFGCSTSKTATVKSLGPVTIAFLRTLVDANYVVTNTVSRWQLTGIVTTYTNLTTGDTSSYYLWDGTDSLNIFTTHGGGLNGSPLIRPNQGDVVTFKGWMSSFNSNLELEGDTADPTTLYTFLSNNVAALPAVQVIPFNITNNTAYCETNLEGRIVMLTNVYFGTNAGTMINTNTGVNATTIVVTNAAGETFNVGFAAVDLDTAGQILPNFAYSVVGAFAQNLGNAASPRNAGYQVTVNRFSDIVTDAPPPIVASISHSGNLGTSSTLTWPLAARDTVNYSYGSNYSYSVLAATSVGGPYAPQTIYSAILVGTNEVPVVPTSAIGFGSVVLSPDQSMMTVNLRFSGLTAAATAAHIHGPAGPGTNASVLFPFSGVPNATGGSIPEQSFSITPTQLGYLQNGLLYMNVHDGNNPGGEIRGWLYLAPSVGLTTPNSATTATYTDPAASGSPKFYRVTSP